MWIGDLIEKFENKAYSINGVTYYPADTVLDELNTLSRQSVRWMEEDFEKQAIENYDPFTWEIYYDKSKFKEALEEMIYRHDCQLGITWDTVEYYLEEYCKRSENSIKKALSTNDEETEI